MSCFTIFGATFDSDLYFSRHVAERILSVSDGSTLDFEALLEIDYIHRLNVLRLGKGGGFYGHKQTHCILRDGEYMGDIMTLLEVAVNEFGIEDAEIANSALFEKHGKQDTAQLVSALPHPVVFLELCKEKSGKDAEILGTLLIELFVDLCPHACENFVLLCTGENGRIGDDEVPLHYEGTPIHRIVPGGWLQCGDIVDGSGENNTYSAFGEKFADECYSVDFSVKIGGVLGYVNKEKHSNGSQFFITLGPCEWMNDTKVGFGRVVQGYAVLKSVDSTSLINQRPHPSIIIRHCGRFTLHQESNQE